MVVETSLPNVVKSLMNSRAILMKNRRSNLCFPALRLGDSKRIPNVENALFDLFKNEENEVPINKFFLALETTGLQKNDPRLRETLENLERVAAAETEKEGEPVSIDNLHLDKDTFKSVVSYNIVLISKAFRQQFVIPEFIHFTKHIEDCYRKCSDIKDGKNASYIPQLAKMNSDYWGISVCTVDGQRFSLGDFNVPFTMQSTSKVLTYVVAHSELGSEQIHKYIGQEPSGRMFNELVLDHNQKPHNPMINAGAILTASLLQTLVHPEMKHSEKFDWLMSYFKRLAGGQPIGFNNAVFMSEREDADRNFALAYYMKENHCFTDGTDLNTNDLFS
ncbi:unnamed protein product [Notodromas monacha]|uniref:glutaminase n=1 Tax=Notodromas monacha TaxID=399045 RepID=A0A7R9BNU1_9CRUS|nr:unnamed protein product [Notodromas monacha]CAG0918944.1 unnamed protein product [Notodromas monacha]